MKIEQNGEIFRPLIITLESAKECGYLAEVLDNDVTYEGKKEIMINDLHLRLVRAKLGTSA